MFHSLLSLKHGRNMVCEVFWFLFLHPWELPMSNRKCWFFVAVFCWNNPLLCKSCWWHFLCTCLSKYVLAIIGFSCCLELIPMSSLFLYKQVNTNGFLKYSKETGIYRKDFILHLWYILVINELFLWLSATSKVINTVPGKAANDRILLTL